MFPLFFYIAAALAQDAAATDLESAEVAPTNVEEATAQPFLIQGDLRGEYLFGQPIVVTLAIRNNSSESAEFPNLSARPWLVRFTVEAIGSSNQTQTRFTTPPEVDPMVVWTIPPRGMRTVDIEIPSSRSLRRGDYNISIEVGGQAGIFDVANTQMVIANPSPIANHLPSEVIGIERTGLHATWLHRANDGFDLYIHSVSGDQVSSDGFNTHIAHLSGSIDPTLSRSLPAQAQNRFVYWKYGERGIGFIESSGETQNRASAVELPYPQIEMLCRGATTPAGVLLIPLWIPSPAGITGEVRVAEIHNGQLEAVTSVSRMRSKPAWAESGIDNAGALRLLIGHGDGVDLYTLTGTSGLPARGVRVIQGGGTSTRGALGISTYEEHQGLAIITANISVVEPTEVEAEQPTELIATKWWTLNGDLIDTPEPIALAGNGNQIERLLSGPNGLWVLNYHGEAGGNMFANQRGAGSLGPTQHLSWDASGDLWLRTVEGNSPISAQAAN